jgi:hypothetical protein
MASFGCWDIGLELPGGWRSSQKASAAVTQARERILKISPSWPWKDAFPACWPRLCALRAPL